MRQHFHTVGSAAIALVGLVSALSAPASASESDPASAMSGSLGVSLEDLDFSNGAGTTVFLLNLGFALAFAAYAFVATRPKQRSVQRIPVRVTSNFAS